MTYAQKLRSPHWQKKRLQILERDNWACRCCNATNKPLQVHHLYYRKVEPWEYPDEAYQTLCEDCHGLRQQIVDNRIEEVKIAIANYTSRELELVLKNIVEYARYPFGAIPGVQEWETREDPKDDEDQEGN